eukprot:6013788-Pleurochrysis_carterae.AAC.2
MQASWRLAPACVQTHRPRVCLCLFARVRSVRAHAHEGACACARSCARQARVRDVLRLPLGACRTPPREASPLPSARLRPSCACERIHAQPHSDHAAAPARAPLRACSRAHHRCFCAHTSLARAQEPTCDHMRAHCSRAALQ